MNKINDERYIVNDNDENLIKLYQIFKEYSKDEIINHIENNIERYGLARERTKRNEFDDKEKIEKYKKAYINLRKKYNEDRDVLDFYTLMFYSFSQQFRFNSKNEFNMPCGNDCFSEKNKEYIESGCDFFKKNNVHITNNDFKKIKVEKIKKDDFVYLDPPYLNTTATYNENDGWNINDENELYNLCTSLNEKGIRFGMSNVFENKNTKNTKLIEWCEENEWNVYTFNSFTYCACGKGNSNAKEVYICNYLIKK